MACSTPDLVTLRRQSGHTWRLRPEYLVHLEPTH